MIVSFKIMNCSLSNSNMVFIKYVNNSLANMTVLLNNITSRSTRRVAYVGMSSLV